MKLFTNGATKLRQEIMENLTDNQSEQNVIAKFIQNQSEVFFGVSPKLN